MKREKTKYPGVYFRLQKRLASSALERIYYIVYRKGGRGMPLIEEPVGRESEGMTAAKAKNIREARARGREHTNKEHREKVSAALRAEESRLTIHKLWLLYDGENAGRKMRYTDTNFYQNHLEKSFGHRSPEELTTSEINSLRQRLSVGRKPATVKHIMALLKRIINYGVKNGQCPQMDPAKLQFNFPRVDNQKTENLSAAQMKSYLAALDEEPDQNAAALLRLALVTGMRRGALFSLRWSDVDFERGFITLRGEAAKNNKTELIPMSKAARLILYSVQHSKSLYVFPGRFGNRRTDIKRIARRVRDKAGLPKDFRPMHGLRHTFASWMASSGEVDLYTLQRLLTHSSPQMTQRYAHLADEALRRAASVADKVIGGI